MQVFALNFMFPCRRNPDSGTAVISGTDWPIVVDDDGHAQELMPEKLNQRSRGRHDPGSGPLINRWVFSDQGPEAHWLNGDVSPGCFSWDVSLIDGSDPRNDHYRASYRAGWPNFMQYQIWHSNAGDPYYYVTFQGYNLVNPDEWPGRYRVYASCEYRSDSRSFIDRYYGGVEGSEAAAQSYLNDLITEYNMGYGSVRPYWYRRSVMVWDKGFLRFDHGREPKFSNSPNYFPDEIELNVGNGKGVNSLIANAYVDACNSLPDASGMSNAVNAIQLATAGVSLLRGVISRDLGSLSKSELTLRTAKDAWLAYRYSYGTTKADITEAANLLSRASDLLFTDRVRCNGTAFHTAKDGSQYTARCAIQLEKSTLSSLKSTIEKYGLQLDGYAMWDLVPYSFVVDWFLGVGDALEFGRRTNFARRVNTKLCWCSIERKFVNEFGFEELFYYRWLGQPDCSAATIVHHDPSGATIVKRALDAYALFT